VQVVAHDALLCPQASRHPGTEMATKQIHPLTPAPQIDRRGLVRVVVPDRVQRASRQRDTQPVRPVPGFDRAPRSHPRSGQASRCLARPAAIDHKLCTRSNGIAPTGRAASTSHTPEASPLALPAAGTIEGGCFEPDRTPPHSSGSSRRPRVSNGQPPTSRCVHRGAGPVSSSCVGSGLDGGCHAWRPHSGQRNRCPCRTAPSALATCRVGRSDGTLCRTRPGGVLLSDTTRALTC
jgi:hypothetical protein